MVCIDGSSLKRVSEIVVKFVFNSLFSCGGGLLNSLLLALLLLGGSGFLLNAVDLLNHECASDSVLDGSMGEDTNSIKQKAAAPEKKKGKKKGVKKATTAAKK